MKRGSKVVLSVLVALLGFGAAALAQGVAVELGPAGGVSAEVRAPNDALHAAVVTPDDAVHAGVGASSGPPHEEIGPEAAAAAALTPGDAPTATVTVQVRQLDESFRPRPVEGVAVRLHVMRPPHEMVGTQTRRTDADGEVVFETVSGPGLTATAEVSSGRRFFSPAVALDEAGEHSTTIEVYRTTSDPSVVFAASLQSIVELWEGYITFTELWTFDVNQPVSFSGDAERPETLIRLSLPDGAEGARVVRPDDRAEIVDGVVELAAEVAPLGGESRGGSDLVLQYSIKSHNRSRVEWERRLSMNVHHLSIVVPQTSRFERFPTLDVDIEVPRCGVNTPSDVVCFDSVDDDSDGLQLRAGTAMRVARGHGRAGQLLRVATVGWPSSPRWERPAVLAIGALALVLGLALVARERGRRTGPEAVLAQRLEALRAQRDALFRSGADLEVRLAAGEMIESDYEAARERVLGRLGVVYRRLRELGAEPSSE